MLSLNYCKPICAPVCSRMELDTHFLRKGNEKSIDEYLWQVTSWQKNGWLTYWVLFIWTGRTHATLYDIHFQYALELQHRQHAQPAQFLDPLFMDSYNVSTSWRCCTSPFHPLLYSVSYLQFSDLTGVWMTHECPHFSCLFWSDSKHYGVMAFCQVIHVEIRITRKMANQNVQEFDSNVPILHALSK